jgi:hypothetical protein
MRDSCLKFTAKQSPALPCQDYCQSWHLVCHGVSPP